MVVITNKINNLPKTYFSLQQEIVNVMIVVNVSEGKVARIFEF